MKYTFIATFFLSLYTFAFGAPDILPSNERSKTYQVSTSLDKKKAFQKIVLWSVKNFVDSNESIKLKDADLGLLIAKTNVECDALKLGSGYAKNQRVEFTISISLGDKTAEIKVEDVVGRGDDYDDGSRPSTKEEMITTINACIKPVVDDITTQLK